MATDLLKKIKKIPKGKEDNKKRAINVEELIGHNPMGDKREIQEIDDKNQFGSKKEDNVNQHEDVPIDAENVQNTSQNVITSEIEQNTYSLPSGRKVRCKTYLVMEPEKETRVWVHNPRYGEDPPVDDIQSSILSTGTNMTAALVFSNDGMLDVIAGSRRRKATIQVRKPFQVTELFDCPIEDAKDLAILENEGKLTPTVFSTSRSYESMVNGDNPIAKNRSDLSRILCSDRAWITQVVDITLLPLAMLEKVMPIKEQYKVEYKPAIKMQKRWRSMSEIERDEILGKLKKLETLSYEGLKELFLKSGNSKEQTVSSKITFEQEIHPGSFIVSNKKSGKALYIPINGDNIDKDSLLEILMGTIESLNN